MHGSVQWNLNKFPDGRNEEKKQRKILINLISNPCVPSPRATTVDF